MEETDLADRYRWVDLDREKASFGYIEKCCKRNGVSIETLRGGSRMRLVSEARKELALKLAKEFGLSFAETARLLGVSTSGVGKLIAREKANKSLWSTTSPHTIFTYQSFAFGWVNFRLSKLHATPSGHRFLLRTEPVVHCLACFLIVFPNQ